MNAEPAAAAGGTVVRGGRPRLVLPPGRLLLRAPVFAAVATGTGTWLTVRTWADCPLGNDARAGFFLAFGTVPVVWAAMTAALLLSQLSLWAVTLPVPGLRRVRFLPTVAAVVILIVVYRAGMQSPVVHPDGTCYDGYPPFPFEPKPGPFGPHGT